MFDVRTSSLRQFLFALILVTGVGVTLGLLAAVNTASASSPNLLFDISGSDATITGCDGACPTALDIPDTVYVSTIPYSVTSIGASAFQDQTGITSVSLPDTLTEIDNDAFSGTTGLIAISLGGASTSSLATIGNSAFLGSTLVSSLVIPDSVTEIGLNAFDGYTSLTTLTMGSSLQKIRNYAFRNAPIAPLDFPAGLTHIYVGAFYGNAEVTSLVIPDSVTTLQNDAFYGASKLQTLALGNGLSTLGNSAFFGASSLTTLTFGTGFQQTGSYSFSGASNLVSVSFPAGMRHINDYAFQGASKLTSLAFGDSLISIRNGAFEGAASLRSVVVGTGFTRLNNDAFKDTSNLTFFRFYGNYPSNVTGGVGNAFPNSALSNVCISLSATGWTSAYEGLPTVTEAGTCTPVSVTFNYNGASGGDSIASVLVGPGLPADAVLPRPTKSEEVFTGWFNTQSLLQGKRISTLVPSDAGSVFAGYIPPELAQVLGLS